MAGFPLRGDGIEIRENKAKSDEDRRKYNIFIDPNLHNILMNPSQWSDNEDTGRKVFGYVATEEGYEAAASDDKCPTG